MPTSRSSRKKTASDRSVSTGFAESGNSDSAEVHSRRTCLNQTRPAASWRPSGMSLFVRISLLFIGVAACFAIGFNGEPSAKSSDELNLSAGADFSKFSNDQKKILNALYSENYEAVAALAAEAKQHKEYEQVAQDTLQKAKSLGGYSAVQVDAFFSSLMMIIVSELGDKTFFIAAVMAMKHPRGIIMAGALGALGVMTVLSAAAGFALPSLLPRVYTHYASVILFICFGAKLLKDAREMKDEGPSEELEEVEAELNKVDKKKNPDVESTDSPSYSGGSGGGGARLVVNSVVWQAFTLTFLAEWGDRSQIATIALAAQKDPVGVAVGGIIGHAVCTGIAVVGGRMLASRISERTVSYSGGLLFLVFAIHGLWQGGSGLHNA